jgi:hypothetical protein
MALDSQRGRDYRICAKARVRLILSSALIYPRAASRALLARAHLQCGACRALSCGSTGSCLGCCDDRPPRSAALGDAGRGRVRVFGRYRRCITRVPVASVRAAAEECADPAIGAIAAALGYRHTVGQWRDGGSYADRLGLVAVWNSVMDEHNYLVRR